MSDDSSDSRSFVNRRNFLRVSGATTIAGLAGCQGQQGGGGGGGGAEDTPSPTPQVGSPAAMSPTPTETEGGEQTESPTETSTPSGSAGTDIDTVTVGAIYPLTGPSGEAGTFIRKFLEGVAMPAINGAHPDLKPLSLAESEGLPNLGNAKVEIKFRDHRSDPAAGRAEAEDMIKSGNIDVLLGGYNSSVTKTMSQAANRLQFPHVNAESSSPDLTTRGLEWFWRTGPHDKVYSRNMFQMLSGMNERRDLSGERKIDKLAIIHEDTEWGSTNARVQTNFAKDRGYNVVENIAYNTKQVSTLKPQLQRIRSADPDVLMPSAYLKGAKIIMQNLRDMGYTPPMILAQSAGWAKPSFKNNPALSEYTLSRSTFVGDLAKNNDALGRYQQFAKDQVGIGFNGTYIRSFGGLISTMTAINNAGSVEPQAIADGLNNLDLPAVKSGLPFGVEFRQEGPQLHQNKHAAGVIFEFVDNNDDGKCERNLVWPFKFSNYEIDYPMPTWSDRGLD